MRKTLSEAARARLSAGMRRVVVSGNPRLGEGIVQAIVAGLWRHVDTALVEAMNGRLWDGRAAELYARRVHAGLLDKGNKPYTGHLMRVAARARAHAEALGWPPERAQLVADAGWLHDTIEDTPVDSIDLMEAGFDPVVIAAVGRLTKPKGVPYLDAIRALIATGDAVAVLVKLADNEDNTDMARPGSAQLTMEQIDRYLRSAAMLRAAVEDIRAGGDDAG